MLHLKQNASCGGRLQAVAHVQQSPGKLITHGSHLVR